jgi:hypothetical protein
VLSKVDSCWAAARLSGQDDRASGPLFSILVLVAIVATLVASPVFEVDGPRRRAV